MVCPLCGQRKAKRVCPGVKDQICAVCCGTKRLSEIQCPSDCSYLSAARAHPPAVVQRRQEVDRAMFLPLLAGFSERQARILMMFGAVIARHEPDLLHKLRDEDIAEAAAAHASTLETAGRGIVYEHRAATVPAERLLRDFKALTTEMTKDGGSVLERDMAIALRRLEAGARERAKAEPSGNSFQQLLLRTLLSSDRPAPVQSAVPPGSPTIIQP